MNYCDQIHYDLFETTKADFPEMVDRLLAQLPTDKVVLRLAFFGTPSTNEEYLTRKLILCDKIQTRFGAQMPAISYVSQPPLNAPLIMEVHSFLPTDVEVLSFRNYKGIPYVVMENALARILFAGGFQTDIIRMSVAEQSVEVFEWVEGLLKVEGFPVNSIIRQWNYIEQITNFDGEDQHYQSFNNARSDFYATTNWPKGYPAATGIGTNLGGILIDLDAVVFKTGNAYATAIDNKLQVAAHAYSDHVLEVACRKKTTPKFERAKRMTFDDQSILYISGTAAIRGEESLKGVGLKQQLYITMENIAGLIGPAKLICLRVYLKNKTDYEETARLMNAYGLNIPISYMWADVCREELLIEIEGIAK